MNIDSHSQFWMYDRVRQHWIEDTITALIRHFLTGELAVQLQANDFDASIAVQADQSELETLFLLELGKNSKRIAGVVGWIDIASTRVEERLEFFSQFEKLRGFRHVAQAEPDDRFLMRSDFTHGISRLREFGFTYDILVYPKQLPAAIDLVAKYGDQRFVVDHLAKPEIKAKSITEWAARMGDIARNPNVYCKLSGLVTEADWHHWARSDFEPYLDVVFEAFGVDRLMFGSDWPVILLSGIYVQWKSLIEKYMENFPVEDQQKVF